MDRTVGKTLALDVGDRRIGIAISDDLGLTARGLLVLESVSVKKDTSKILDILKENKCLRIVAGLPVKLDGTDSLQTEKVRQFAAALENKLRSNAMGDIPVILHDERFSTKIAEETLIEAGVRREKRKEIIDKQAAAVILQDWLETQK
ncbi:MAG: Holliday junction resolvase RuvX [Clostridiales bacterium]|nr:Holliday junction resolvase RuvX [Clostridiales bacterium]